MMMIRAVQIVMVITTTLVVVIYVFISCRGGCLGDDKDVVIKYPGYHMERNRLTQTESRGGCMYAFVRTINDNDENGCSGGHDNDDDDDDDGEDSGESTHSLKLNKVKP